MCLGFCLKVHLDRTYCLEFWQGACLVSSVTASMFTKQNKSLWLLTLSKPGLTWALDGCYFLGIKLKSISEAYLEDYKRKGKKMWKQHSNSAESIQWMITFIIMMCCHRSLPFLIYLCLIFFWRRKLQPTPVFMPGKSHGPRSLVGYNPWGCKELHTTEQLLCVCVCVCVYLFLLII